VTDRTYFYVVRAFKEGLGESENSEKAEAVAKNNLPPKKTSNFSAVPTPKAHGWSITLQWERNSEKDLGGYNLKRSVNEKGPYQLVSRVNADRTSFTDTTVRPGQVYYYKLSAFDTGAPPNEGGSSLKEISTEDLVPPTVPQIYSLLSAGDGKVNISWTASADPSGIMGYYIWRKASAQGSFSKINESPVKGISYIDSGLDPGMAYFYLVTAVDSSQNQNQTGFSGEKEVFVPKAITDLSPEEVKGEGVLDGGLKIDPGSFRPSKGEKVNISYGLKYNAKVTIMIYDLVRGVIWQRTFDSGKDGGRAGENSCAWGGGNSRGRLVRSGIYYVHLNCSFGGKNFLLAMDKVKVL
jgi:hypothetical protein